MSVKEDWPRPYTTGRRERELRKELAYGEIDRRTFDALYMGLLAMGLVKRNGRQIGGNGCE